MYFNKIKKIKANVYLKKSIFICLVNECSLNETCDEIFSLNK